jgi:predicted regulator of Ras-like GTPase activity (Roadblock/LC7/MglB family)/CheY-like chemotaxis protein
MLERDRPDVVICDVVLPDKDGYQICEYVRSHTAMGTTPVMLISGIDNGTVQARAAEVRSDEVMFKPFGVDDLVRKIDRLLESRSPASPTPVAPAIRVAAPAPAPTPVVPAATPVPEVTTAAAAPESPGGIKERLGSLAATPGVRFVVLTDRDGFLIETAGDFSAETDEVAGALASCLAEASDGIGRELGQGQLMGTILEYEAGTLLLQAVGPEALLAVLVDEPGALGKIRYYVRKVVPELARVL